jgi:uncharacterized membrane protein YjjP (DUF1212 family)
VDPFSDDEQWPDEPEQFDPDSIGPETPDATDIDAETLESVPEGLFRAFVGSAIMLNVALFGLSLGAMLIYFRGDWQVGGAALAAGVAGGVFTARYYWQYRRGDFEEGTES